MTVEPIGGECVKCGSVTGLKSPTGHWTCGDCLSGPFIDLLNGEPPTPPSMVETILRHDNKPLLYEGRAHSLTGVSEAGKTMLVYYWAVVHAAWGSRAIIADYEMGHVWAHQRALTVGMETIDKTSGGAIYLADSMPIGDVLKECGEGDLLVIDSADRAYMALGLNPNFTEDAVRFTEAVIEPARQQNVTLVLLDHVTTTNADKRGAAGNFRKLADVDVAYKFTAKQPLSKGEPGYMKLYVEKDRGGQLDYYVDRTPKGETSRIMADIEMIPNANRVTIIQRYPSYTKRLDEYGGFPEGAINDTLDRVIGVLRKSGEMGKVELRSAVKGDNTLIDQACRFGVDMGVLVREEKKNKLVHKLSASMLPDSAAAGSGDSAAVDPQQGRAQ